MGYFTDEDIKNIRKLKKKPERKTRSRRDGGRRSFGQPGSLGKLFRILGSILGLLLILAVTLVVVLTVTEFKPEARETLEVVSDGKTSAARIGSPLRVMTWNIGYGALGNNADFFLDGGSSVHTASADRVNRNIDGIVSVTKALNADVCFFQEVDTQALRSHFVNEPEEISNRLFARDEVSRDHTFAYNYRSLFIPYPIPPIGTVNAGIYTTSRYSITSSERVQLPCPFTWPESVGNLKRCLVVSRVPVEGSRKELVLVNLHLEAYDSGEGKAAQTAMLRELLEEEAAKGNYVIAAGDFNQSFSNADISEYPVYEGKWQAGQIDVSEFPNFQMLMDTSEPSCRSLDQPYAGSDRENFQYYVIDGFICSKNIQVNDVKTHNDEFKSSDHNPVTLDAVLMP